MTLEWGRAPVARTAATPYICKWTAADEDITNIAAPTTVPMRFEEDELDGMDYVTFQFANTADGKSPTFDMVLVDTNLVDAGASDPLPIVCKGVAPVTVNPGRRQDADDSAAGLFFMLPVTVDLRGLPSSGHSHIWFLCCTSVDATYTHLVHYHPWNER